MEKNPHVLFCVLVLLVKAPFLQLAYKLFIAFLLQEHIKIKQYTRDLPVKIWILWSIKLETILISCTFSAMNIQRWENCNITSIFARCFSCMMS